VPHFDTLDKGQVIRTEKLQFSQQALQPACARVDVLRHQGVRNAGMMELVAQGQQRLKRLANHRLYRQPVPPRRLEVEIEQLGHHQQVAIGAILFQDVPQDPQPLTKRGIA
jgi:hypothetical protein